MVCTPVLYDAWIYTCTCVRPSQTFLPPVAVSLHHTPALHTHTAACLVHHTTCRPRRVAAAQLCASHAHKTCCFHPKRHPRNRPTRVAQVSTSSRGHSGKTGLYKHTRPSLKTCTAPVRGHLRAPRAELTAAPREGLWRRDAPIPDAGMRAAVRKMQRRRAEVWALHSTPFPCRPWAFTMPRRRLVQSDDKHRKELSAVCKEC